MRGSTGKAMNATVISSERSPDRTDFHLVHEMLVLDAFLEERLDQRQYETITRQFVDELLGVLDMQALGELGIYPAVDARAPGWSFIQPITTSHISAHYFEKPGRSPHIRLDAYSCESIDWGLLIRVCHGHFILSDWHATFIERHIDAHGQRRVIDLAGVGPQVTSESVLSPNPESNKGGVR